MKIKKVAFILYFTRFLVILSSIAHEMLICIILCVVIGFIA